MNIKLLSNSIKSLLFFGILMPFFDANAQPVITLIGNSTVYVEVGKPYSTLGATAYDTLDGNLTSAMTYSGDVTTDFVGIYSETFSVTNTRGKSSSVSRIVIVRNDLTPPVLTLYGDDTIYIEASRNNPNFSEPGASASDNKAPYNLSSSIIVDGQVNTRRVGIYTLNYTVDDVSGNRAEKTRIVIVRDTKAPQWINGRTPHYLPFGKPFIDSVDIVDAYDASINFLVQIPVGGMIKVNVPGQYDYVYIAEADSSGNVPDTLFVTYIVQQKVSVATTLVNQVNVYPTQFDNKINIQLNSSNGESPIFNMYDINGKHIDIQLTQNNDLNYTLHVTGLSSGVYVLQVSMNGKVYTERLIKD